MPSTISIITPWHGETGQALAGDYYRAVEGSAQVITVDNGCPAATATILSEMTTQLCGEYVRSETNLGFAGGNNAGYAKATGDIIVFLNSDVTPTGPWLAQVAADVKEGALYGPSLQAQLVAGRHVPYLEGWCLAATRATWERLCWSVPGRKSNATRVIGDTSIYGPWDAEAFSGPYWEDNALCLYAFESDIQLVQTQWAIAHKGGQTAGPIMKYGASFAANEATFTARVLASLTLPTMTPTWHRYMQAVYTQSDIQHYLPFLYSLARGNVLELGTRGGNSTTALLAGVEEHGGHVWSVDTADCGGLFEHEQWTFVQGDSVAVAGGEWFGEDDQSFDLLLVDTIHTYEHVTAELSAWSPLMRPGGSVLIHDPETFPGVRRAVTEFCEKKGWPVTFILPCNGMAVVEVPKG